MGGEDSLFFFFALTLLVTYLDRLCGRIFCCHHYPILCFLLRQNMQMMNSGKGLHALSSPSHPVLLVGPNTLRFRLDYIIVHYKQDAQ